MKKFPILLLLTACWSLAAAQERPQVPAAQKRNLRTEIIAADSTGELLAQLRTMPSGIYTLMNEYGTQWNRIMAYGVIIVTPVVILFILAQKYIVGGLTSGAVKE